MSLVEYALLALIAFICILAIIFRGASIAWTFNHMKSASLDQQRHDWRHVQTPCCINMRPSSEVGPGRCQVGALVTFILPSRAVDGRVGMA